MNLLTQIRSLFEPAVAAIAPDQAKVPDYLAAIKPSGERRARRLPGQLRDGTGQGARPEAAGRRAGDQSPSFPRTTCSNRRRSRGRGSSTCASSRTSSRKRFSRSRPTRTSASNRPRSRADVRHRLQLARTSPSRCTSATSAARSSATPSTRLLRFLGHTVVTDNHLGDWGTQFGMLLYGYKQLPRRRGVTRPTRCANWSRLYVHVRQSRKKAGGRRGRRARPPTRS